MKLRIALVCLALSFPGPARAFRWSVWTSGMTVEQALQVARRNDLPLLPEGVPSGGSRLDPRAAAAAKDTATELSYKAELRGLPATVRLSFHPTTRRLYSLGMRWVGAGRASPFLRQLLSTLSRDHGSPKKGKDPGNFFRDLYAWPREGKDQVLVLVGASDAELRYVDTSLLPAGTAVRKPGPGTGLFRFLLALGFALALLRALFRLPGVRGWWGELKVRAALLALDRKTYRVLYDVTLPAADGTSQIDHVVLAPSGIYVIETKNYSGWIFGQPREPYWTWKKFRRTERFQNPLRQNAGHVRALREVLGCPAGAFHYLVVFAGAARFKTEMPPSVLRLAELVPYVKARSDRAFTAAELEALAARIEKIRLPPGLATSRAHRDSVRTRLARRAPSPSAGKPKAPSPPSPEPKAPPVIALPTVPSCPRCGAVMTLRLGWRGNPDAPFWRCTGFPRCGGILGASPEPAP